MRIEKMSINGAEYKVYNGTYFYSQTEDNLIYIIDNLLKTRERVRVWFGDNSEVWAEDNDVIGTIGRSTGIVKITLLIYNSRSLGGGALSTDRILKIIGSDKRVIYQHKDFKEIAVEIKEGASDNYPFQVFLNGKNAANFKTMEKAKRWADFMIGKRLNK